MANFPNQYQYVTNFLIQNSGIKVNYNNSPSFAWILNGKMILHPNSYWKLQMTFCALKISSGSSTNKQAASVLFQTFVNSWINRSAVAKTLKASLLPHLLPGNIRRKMDRRNEKQA
jgi:hypothetical protein